VDTPKKTRSPHNPINKENNTKVCTGCRVALRVSAFSKRSSNKDGLNCKCKKCIRLDYSRNKGEILAKSKAKRAANPDAARKRERKYRESHPEILRRYREANKDKLKAKARERYWKNRDPSKPTREEKADYIGDILAAINESPFGVTSDDIGKKIGKCGQSVINASKRSGFGSFKSLLDEARARKIDELFGADKQMTIKAASVVFGISKPTIPRIYERVFGVDLYIAHPRETIADVDCIGTMITGEFRCVGVELVERSDGHRQNIYRCECAECGYKKKAKKSGFGLKMFLGCPVCRAAAEKKQRTEMRTKQKRENIEKMHASNRLQRRESLMRMFGRRFGRLTVLGRSAGSGSHKKAKWDCVCDCGETLSVCTGTLRGDRRKTQSCGCFLREFNEKHNPPNENPLNRGVLSKWRAHVLKTRDAECVVCGSADDLHAHHIYARCIAPELALDTNNAIILCSECHKELHSDLGFKTTFASTARFLKKQGRTDGLNLQQKAGSGLGFTQ